MQMKPKRFKVFLLISMAIAVFHWGAALSDSSQEAARKINGWMAKPATGEALKYVGHWYMTFFTVDGKEHSYDIGDFTLDLYEDGTYDGCMTEFNEENILFGNWYYFNDKVHISNGMFDTLMTPDGYGNLLMELRDKDESYYLMFVKDTGHVSSVSNDPPVSTPSPTPTSTPRPTAEPTATPWVIHDLSAVKTPRELGQQIDSPKELMGHWILYYEYANNSWTEFYFLDEQNGLTRSYDELTKKLDEYTPFTYTIKGRVLTLHGGGDWNGVRLSYHDSTVISMEILDDEYFEYCPLKKYNSFDQPMVQVTAEPTPLPSLSGDTSMDHQMTLEDFESRARAEPNTIGELLEGFHSTKKPTDPFGVWVGAVYAGQTSAEIFIFQENGMSYHIYWQNDGPWEIKESKLLDVVHDYTGGIFDDGFYSMEKRSIRGDTEENKVYWYQFGWTELLWRDENNGYTKYEPEGIDSSHPLAVK